jgi:hypothetical protein
VLASCLLSFYELPIVFCRRLGEPVQLVPAGSAFLRHRLALPGSDTVSLDDWVYAHA